ncbi:DUF4139 domain-containing protein [soil metagenome]
MISKLILTIAISFSFLFASAKDDKNQLQANLKSVTVYRSGAEMLHTASATLKQGNNELIIDNLSNNIDINSIQIKAPAAVTILGIEFSNNYIVNEKKTPRMQSLEDSLQRVQENIGKIDLSVNNNNELLEVLKANQNIKGEQTGLSVTELTKLMDYYQNKSLELQNNIAQLTEKKKKATELADKIQKQITEEQKKNVSTAGRLTLQLSAAIATKAEFSITYIARNAYWTPFYDVRVENTKSAAKLLYKAKIVQTTGIDWKQIKLSLSTSVPNQKGNAPVLQSWFLGYVDPYAINNNNMLMNTLQGRVAGVTVRDASQLSEVVVTGYSSSNSNDIDKSYTAPEPVYVVNGSFMSKEEFANINPNSIKKIDVLNAKAATAIYGSRAEGGATVIEFKEGLEDYVSVANNALNVNFDIDMPYDVPTNGKEQTATLQVADMNTLYQHYAVPKLDADAYLLAQIPDWEKLNLLPGEANIILEGTYVGKTFIDPNATADTLNLTLGHDKRVVIKREKLNDFSSVKFLGSNKLQQFTYEITIKNNKNEPVDVLLKDQYPLTTNKDIEVALTEPAGAEVNKDLGVLNWKLYLAPNETKKIRFSYNIKYPKDKTINLN